MATDQQAVKLKKRRAIIQGSCTRIRTFVDSVTTVSTSVAAQLEERRAKLDTHWAEYDNVQTELELLDEDEANHRIGFEDTFYSLSAAVRELLASVPLSRTAASRSPASTMLSETTESLARVRLPKLDLPTFSGNYDEWFPFFDSFRTLIHANESLNDIQRLQYLKSAVTADASNIISALEISAVNYNVAWNLLKERYDNKRVIVQKHIKAITDLPSMGKENSVELRQVADGATRHIRALQALQRPTAHWDDLLVHILSNKLDSVTMRAWQSSLTTTELPTLRQFLDFITHRCQVLASTSKSNAANPKAVNSRPPANAKHQTSGAATVKIKCSHCGGEHSVYNCSEFLALTVPQRIADMRKRKICVNCLRFNHASSKCPSGNCRICKLRHNTLLHLSSTEACSDQNSREETSPTAVVSHSLSAHQDDHTMLSTAIAHVYDNAGSQKSCRILLDCGSQVNFISRKLLDALGIKSRPSNISISGVNQTVSKATQTAQVRLQSRINSFSATIDCIVTEQITERLPAFTFKRGSFELPRNIKLADPRFHVSADIDILIGADLFWRTLCVGQIKASYACPLLQKTRFGWILAGRFDNIAGAPRNVQSLHASVTNCELHEQVARFWDLETIENANSLTSEEALCEQHFTNNLSRTQAGRYIVKLPFKEPILHKLGDSRATAIKRLYGIEKRLNRDPNLRDQYASFLREYLAMGHMKQVEEPGDGESFYLPHHCVFRVTSTSSKIRVVFDASSKSTTGVSLNDALMVGPVVQQDLASILIRFRTFRYGLSADIIKMYRQVLVDTSQTRYQRILWREDPVSEIKTYELTTVTYGTSSASYLATRCLKHLADLYKNEYPVGSVCVRRDFYVDDILTGADTLRDAKIVRDQVIDLLQQGAFELSKWASSCPKLLHGLGNQAKDMITINDEANSCVLGIQWNQNLDTFSFAYRPDETSGVVSKRLILSEVSRLFDPLGLLGPVIVLAKLILQDLWQAGTHWDESVPPDVHTRWLDLKSQLSSINQITIPRCAKFNTKPRRMQIHGFCDASERAYGACVYVRTQDEDGKYRSELLCSKSRVSPIKVVSLPRLELSAALLLARLIEKLRSALDLTHARIILWSDSTITLNWISSQSRKWSVFVANRVGEIQRLTEIEAWSHIASGDNPADILSRGLEPSQLASAAMWWHGPEFLAMHEDHWPVSDFVRLEENIPERKRAVVNLATLDYPIITELLNNYSSLDKACRVLTYCLRFFKSRRPSSSTAFVSYSETLSAQDLMCKLVQKLAFPAEHKALTDGRAISASSSLLSLSPFLAADGLIRVGGRLNHSELSYDARHPVLLPRSHHLTKRVIEREHMGTAHAGVQATMAAVRQRFWPLSLRSVTRQIIQKCVICFRAKPVQSEIIMAPLPAGRVTASRPFFHCGVDYAGPLILRESKRRNARNLKAYVSIFVCFATKAVHIELVSDLTADAFVGALKRFVSRRGKPACIFSDNGTNFVGANKQLKELREFVSDEQTRTEVQHFLREHGTSWNFIPPSAPHFGGLWEAAVKSAKHHLNRIVGKAHLTFEEMQTTLCEIEAILNSRPLTPLSADPNDLAYLSPGHFLVGTPLTSFPYSDISHVSENRLVRWQRVEQLRQHFWRRWSAEYLNTLQQRTKWKASKGQQLEVDQVVLIKQQGLSPLQWLLGRVEQVHAGSDGQVRAATVKTMSGLITRPLSKIAILPIDD